ncbi:DNA polymerase III subunit delta' [Salinivibrio kushneri]|uniref:DNA polymerase III subunit delta' n=1 Tax=Salinivibrio kushneri TaxID=1908198 RepID=UPI0022B313AE|nr:DNA polymerase III subunit delta' [Salinivibrio kushneri]WBA17054.1 DNA polymerase III subunit delta' [Salinivibrio kushneri]
MSDKITLAYPAPCVYPWFEGVWAYWQQLLISARFPHALLLAAPPGSGRRALISQLAKVRLCSDQTDSACGHCHHCQLFAAGNHPDIHWLAPEKPGKQIGIDAVRKVQRQALETSQLGGARFIVIECVERLGEAAANALLKSLEEPPSGCYFVLLTDSLDSLLATIVSRCSVWKAPQAEADTAKAWIEQALQRSVPDHAVGLYRGAPLAASDFVASGGLDHHHAVVEGFSTYVCERAGLFDTIEVLVAHYPASLNWLSHFLLDVLKWRQGVGQTIVHRHHHQRVAEVANALTTQQAHSLLRALHQLQRQLQIHTGLNTELVVSQWLLSIGE